MAELDAFERLVAEAVAEEMDQTLDRQIECTRQWFSEFLVVNGRQPTKRELLHKIAAERGDRPVVLAALTAALWRLTQERIGG